MSFGRNPNDMPFASLTTEIADEFGNTVIDLTADGDIAGDVFTEFILYGAKNGSFSNGPLAGTGVDIDPNDFQRRMPYWDGPTDVTGGGITWQWVADSGSPSGYNLQATVPAGCAVGTESQMEQIIPIGGSRGRALNHVVRAFQWTSDSTQVDVVVKLSYLDVTGATVGGATVSASSTDNKYVFIYGHLIGGQSPPATARYLRIRLHVSRIAGSAANTASFSDVRVETAHPGIYVAERDDPSNYSAASLNQYSGVLYVTPNYLGQHTTAPTITLDDANALTTVYGKLAVTGSVAMGDTSFPVSPSNNDLFYRTDRDVLYYYDGTRWLSVSIYVNTPMAQVGSSLPYAATASNADRIAFPSSIAGSTTFYIVDCYVTFRIAGGGTALDASNKWTVGVDQTDGANLTTFSIASGASGAFRSSTNSINTVVSGPLGYEIDYTKTGTPGNFMGRTEMTYRLIG